MPLGTPGSAPPAPSSRPAAPAPDPPSRAALVFAVLAVAFGSLFTVVFGLHDGLGGAFRFLWLAGFLALTLAGVGILTHAVSVHGFRIAWKTLSGDGRTESPEERVERLSRKHPVWPALVMLVGAALVAGGIVLSTRGAGAAVQSLKLLLVGGGLFHWGWQARRRARERAAAESDSRRGG